MATPTPEIPFRFRERALENLRKVSKALPESAWIRVCILLAESPDPDSVIHYLEKLLESSPIDFHRLTENIIAGQCLVIVFAHSQFLSEEILRRPGLLNDLLESGDLQRNLNDTEFIIQLEKECADGIPNPLLLATFRRRQLLRILLRDIRGLATLSETTAELSDLAGAILQVAYRHVLAAFRKRYGTPQFLTSDGREHPCEFSIIALGKLGGQELNYSSDIDLLFLYTANGETDGANPIDNKEFYKRIANALTELLSTYTSEGICYRVDLRLRPDGKLGELCMPLAGAKAYYKSRARDWELQMLIKARVAAGEQGPGVDLLVSVEPLIYSSTLDFGAVESVSETRLRIGEQLALKRGGSTDLDIKLERGGIRDIEFLVQCLQRLYGGRDPWVRHGGTLLALSRLHDKALLSPVEYAKLAACYEYLRHMEHRLQYWDDRQTHTLPRDTELLEVLARRMPAWQTGGRASASRLVKQIHFHLEEVREIYERVIHAQQPVFISLAESLEAPLDEEIVPPNEFSSSNVARFLDQKAPRFAALIEKKKTRRGIASLELFLEKTMGHQAGMTALDADPLFARYVLDLFESGPYLAEQLIRTPDLIEEFFRFGAGLNFRDYFEDPVELRRYYRKEIFRIQAESICLRQPIFHTLDQTSQLAEFAIESAYRAAIQQVLAVRPPVSVQYTPRDQMMVIALGRLGMREFDLGSDADLVFVLPDQDASEINFWRRVAERVIDIVSAYTGEGMLFAVDTRLRPSGREGDLLQLESAYMDYFDKHAQAWEGITYMKARGVAGNIEKATDFLNKLQEVDWRRYGQSGRSQSELRKMRLRLEKEQGESNPLKAGVGGYYDIDFSLMYLRLKGAGMFFKLLNTPARIDIIEKMGHLERPDANFLRDAATFYRSIDHAMRLLSGHPEGSLPKAQGQLNILRELVELWVPEHLCDQPLPVEHAQIQDRTREFFNRLFPG